MAIGKISRLPREIREQVNQKLDDGVPGKRLVAWLNELPAVRALLAAEFGGAAINEQNLTNWKLGRYREWQLEQEARACFQSSAGPEKEAERQLRPTTTMATMPVVTTEQLSTLLAVRYWMVMREWERSPVPAERRERKLRVMLREVATLRRREQGAERLEWQQKVEIVKNAEHPGRYRDGARHLELAGRRCEPHWQALPVMEAAWRVENLAELKRIKVDQGGKILNDEVGRNEIIGYGDGPSPSRGKEVECGDDFVRVGGREGSDQGENFLKDVAQNEMVGNGDGPEWPLVKA